MNRDKIKNISSDFELLSLLEAEEEQEQQEIAPEEEVPADECQDGECQPGASVVLAPDGTVQAQNAVANVTVDPSKIVQINVAESSYSDFFLLGLLEENGYDVTYSNLVALKEGIKAGTIVLEDDKPVAEEEQPEEAPAAEEEVPAGECPDGECPEEQGMEPQGDMPRVQISMPVDGSMTIDNNGKQVSADPQGNIVVALAEARALGKMNKLLSSYLTEDCGMDMKEFISLREDTKSESIKEIAKQLFSSIEEKLSGVDTSFADRSRGDIKQLRELPSIQDSLTKLESLLERSESSNPEYVDAVNTIIRSILYINQYSAAFKDAYRNKKTVMIMRYQSLILAIVSSLSFIIAALVETKHGMISIKDSVTEISDYAPLQSLSKFVRSVDSGEFKKIIGDVDTLRENYLEIPVETMSTVLEANDYLPMVIDGVKNLYNNFAKDGKITGLIYKAVGVLVILFSLRDTFYSLFRMKTKVSDMLNQLQLFSNSDGGSGNILGKLSQFASKFVTDAESGSDLAKKDIEAENRGLASNVRQIQASSISAPSMMDDQPQVEKIDRAPAPATSDSLFGFDF